MLKKKKSKYALQSQFQVTSVDKYLSNVFIAITEKDVNIKNWLHFAEDIRSQEWSRSLCGTEKLIQGGGIYSCRSRTADASDVLINTLWGVVAMKDEAAGIKLISNRQFQTVEKIRNWKLNILNRISGTLERFKWIPDARDSGSSCAEWYEKLASFFNIPSERKTGDNF